jgi:hypothetical protein
MLKKVLLAGAALATLGVPAAADAQYYGRSYGSYGHGRNYYWDGHHYRDRNNNAVLDAVIGGLLGYAVGSMSNRSYSYPSYGYGYNNAYYGYPAYGYTNQYSYPSYGYNYQYSYPGYGYSNNYYYDHRRW